MNLLLSNSNPTDISNNRQSDEVMLSATESVMCFDISQYTFAEVGASACTAICLSVSFRLLSILREDNQLISKISITDAIFDGINSLIAADSPSHLARHLSVDELFFMIPPDVIVLNETSPAQGLLTNSQEAFLSVFEQARSLSTHHSSIAIIITKPPETVSVILPSRPSSTSRCYLFDPHSRPQLGLSGSYLRTSTEESDIVRHLVELFPALPSDDYDGNWVGEGAEQNFGAAMYNMFECTFLQLNYRVL